MNLSLRPRTQLDVAKVVPRSIFSVPIKHFGDPFGHILVDFDDWKHMGEVLYCISSKILVPNLKDSDTKRDVKHEDIST